MTKATEWPKSLLFIQSNLNNIKSNFTDKMPNKIIYKFSLNVIFTLNIAAESILPLSASWIEVTDVIDFAKINIKYHYNWKHQPLVIWVGNYALLQLHCEYFISAITNKKLKQQYVELFQIIDWIDQLVYKLDISSHWCVHSVFTVTQLKLCSSLKNDFFNYSHSEESSTVFVKENTESWKFFKLKRLLNQWIIRQEQGQPITQYLAHWKRYGPEYDMWLSLKNLENVINLVKKYDKAFSPHISMMKTMSIPAKRKVFRQKTMS